MSLMQLLTVGKSIERINDANPYRVVEQGMLPNFGTEEEAAPIWGTTAVSAGETPALPVAPTPDPFGPAPAPAAANNVEAAPAARPATRRWVTGHRKKAKDPQDLVQRELALRTIAVVRNDLSEADLEVRPALGVPAPVTQGNLFARPAQDERAVAVKRSWVKRLRERITGFWK